MKEFIREYKWFLLGMVVVFGLTLLFPYTGDDWQWRTWDFSWTVIKSLFTDASINGRYLANIIVLLITKNIILRGIVVSLILCTIVEIISRVTKTSRLYSWIFIGLMPVEMFRQSISWSSGFTNYVMSALLVLINVLIVEKLFDDTDVKWYKRVGYFILFFLSSFFIENVTIFFVLLNLGLLLLYFIKNKRLNVNLLITSLASVIGTVIMFLQPCYKNVAVGSDPYRSLTGGIGNLIFRICNNFMEVMSDFISVENIFVVLCLITLLYISFIRNKNHNKFVKYSFFYMFLYTFYIIGLRIFLDWNPFLSYTKVFNAVATFLFLIILIIDIIIIFKNNESFSRIMLIVFTLIGLVAPLTIVTPIGARNFFGIYMFEIFLVFIVLSTLRLKMNNLRPVFSMLLVLLIGYYITVYGYIQFFSEKRLEYIKETISSGELSVDVPILPYSNYVWVADPVDDYNANYYKSAFDIDSEAKFVFYDYTYWYNEFYLKKDV